MLTNIIANRAAETQVWGWEAADDHGILWREILIPAALEGVQPPGAKERTAGGTSGETEGWQLSQGEWVATLGWLGYDFLPYMFLRRLAFLWHLLGVVHLCLALQNLDSWKSTFEKYRNSHELVSE